MNFLLVLYLLDHRVSLVAFLHFLLSGKNLYSTVFIFSLKVNGKTYFIPSVPGGFWWEVFLCVWFLS